MAEATHSTIELANGGWVHVAHPPSAVHYAVNVARKGKIDSRDSTVDHFVELERQVGDAGISHVGPQSSEWMVFRVDARQIVAIWPLRQRSNTADTQTVI